MDEHESVAEPASRFRKKEMTNISGMMGLKNARPAEHFNPIARPEGAAYSNPYICAMPDWDIETSDEIDSEPKLESLP